MSLLCSIFQSNSVDGGDFSRQSACLGSFINAATGVKDCQYTLKLCVNMG